MIDHVSIAVRDLVRAAQFYEAVLAPLGYAMREARPATVAFGKRYSEFWLNLRPGMTPIDADSGAHVALRATSTALVDAFHAAALAAGGTSDGPPGLRPQHGEGYYAAFIRDPDGNRIEAVTFVNVEPSPEVRAPRSGLPDLGIIDAQIGYSRFACELEGRRPRDLRESRAVHPSRAGCAGHLRMTGNRHAILEMLDR